MADKISTRDAYGEALVELGKVNKNVVVLDADLAVATRTEMFAKVFPERHFNFGIAEANMICHAVGLASCGKIPFASSLAVFATGRVWDQLRTSMCYPGANVKVVGTHGGITIGEDGATHHANEDVAITRAIPGLTVIVPADAIETKKAVFALAEHVGPAYMRVGRAKEAVVLDENYEFEIGKAVVIQPGSDVSIFACGIMLAKSIEAAEMLAKEGISAEVINVSTIKPLDTNTVVGSVSKTGCAVTAEEHSIIGGLGDAVSQAVLEACPVPLERIGVKDTFTESGQPDPLLEKYGLTSKTIAQAARRSFERKASAKLLTTKNDVITTG